MRATNETGRRRMRRGSVLVYILVLTIAMGTIVLSVVSLAGFHYNQVLHDEQGLRAKYAIEGAITTDRYGMEMNTLTIPVTGSTAVGSFSVSRTTSDNSANLANTVTFSGSTSRWNRTFTWTQVLGNPAPVHDPTWWNFAMAMPTSYTFPGHVTTHNPTDDIYASPSFGVTTASTIKRDLYTVSNTAPANVTVQGTFYGNTTAKKWPVPRNFMYAAAATTTLNGNQTLNGYAFASAWQLVYINGDLHISGQVKNTGTFYVTGDIYITNNLTYKDVNNDYCAFITPNTIHFANDPVSAVGWYYAGTLASLEGHITISQGEIVAYAFFHSSGGNKDTELNGDTRITTTPANGVSLKLPGCWP